MLIGVTAQAATTNLAWDANTEADLAGYKLYRSTVSGGPYTIAKTILAPATTTSDITGVDGTYYWVLTAYDGSGNESGYSNQVTRAIDTTCPTVPKVLRFN